MRLKSNSVPVNLVRPKHEVFYLRGWPEVVRMFLDDGTTFYGYSSCPVPLFQFLLPFPIQHWLRDKIPASFGLWVFAHGLFTRVLVRAATTTLSNADIILLSVSMVTPTVRLFRRARPA